MLDKHVYIRKDGGETWCYGVIEEIARKCPLVAVEDPQIISVLFKLLDHEDERLSPRLYAALGALRDVYQERSFLLVREKAESLEMADLVLPKGEEGKEETIEPTMDVDMEPSPATDVSSIVVGIDVTGVKICKAQFAELSDLICARELLL